MSSASRDSFLRPSLNWLTIFLPLAIAIRYLPSWRNDTVLFVVSALAIIPIAGWMGNATEKLAHRFGQGIGGLLNASFGNAAELIIALTALRAGLIDVVKASITGSIIGNLLLVLGASMVAGGIRHPVQRFNRTAARSACTAMMLAASALVIPSIFHQASAGRPSGWSAVAGQHLSLWISGALLASYAAILVFSLVTHRNLYAGANEEPEDDAKAVWTVKSSIVVLVVSTILIAWVSEFLVGAVEAAQHSLGVTETFVGIIIVAVVGNAAEHSTAVSMALKNKMDLALGIAVGSSIQVALFVTPVLVFASYFFTRQLSLEFSFPEVAAVVMASFVAGQISGDGESNWLEGIQLLVLYFIIGLLFYFLPAAR